MHRIAVTGVPGWLTTGMFEDFRKHLGIGFSEVVVLVHPGSTQAAQTFAGSYPWPASVVAYDLGQRTPIAEALKEVDVLVHTAGVIHVNRTSDWYDINAAGTIHLAQEAKRAGVRRFVFVSSIAAAGKSRPGSDLVESDEPKPMHHYGKSKLLAERGVLALQESGVFDVVILRPSMFYGPPVPMRHVEIYKRILYGRMPLVGGGRYRRSVIHIENLAQAVRLAMTSPNAPGQTYFIVDRAVSTTFDVVEAMAEALGTRARYVPIPAAMAETAYQIDRAVSSVGIYIAPIHLLGEAHWHQSASCAKAEHELGYQPHVELREGMANAVQWCRDNALL
jgi:nucleoside-diphosphate-sugar epimerase